MTHASDELLSALIDGEGLPSAEAAHVDECAQCQERLAQLRGVVAVVAAPVAIPVAHMREAAVAAALVETTGLTPAIRRLVPRRDRAVQSYSARRMSTASAAAALIVALGVGGWVLSQIGRDQQRSDAGSTTALRADAQTKSATAADNAANQLFDAASPRGGGASGGAAASGGATETQDDAALTSAYDYGYDAGELGEFSDTESIAAVARGHLAQDDATKAQHAASGSPCPMPDLSQRQIWTAKITYNGQPAAVWILTTESGWILEVRNVNSACAILASQAFEPTPPR